MGLLGAILGQQQRVQFIQKNQSGETTIIQFDASIKETHSRQSPATEFPVENGNVISDHIIVKPFSLELTGIISDTPIGGIKGILSEVATTAAQKLIPPIGLVAGAAGFALFSALSNSKSPSVAAYNQLLSLQSAAQPFDVLTSLYRYSNMWIVDLSAPRDAETGKVLLFTIKLSQLLIVSPQSVNVQVFANPALSANQADMGSQGLNVPNGFQKGLSDFNNLAGGTH